MIVQDPRRARLAKAGASARSDTRGDDAAGPRLGGLLAGTRLLTPAGYTPIDELRRGDLVATMLGRGPLFEPITWIGRRRIATRNGLVRVSRNAVGDAMPDRDVVLAPDHALYLEGALYPAGKLVNGATLMWDLVNVSQTVWAVQLERHDVLMADGLAVESLLDSAALAAYAEMTAPRLRVVDRVGALR
jgi:hypothetical protein